MSDIPGLVKLTSVLTWAVMGMASSFFVTADSQAQTYTQGFNSTSDLTDIVLTNNSTRNTTGNPWGIGDGITDADGNIVVAPFEGDEFALANYTSVGSGTGTISNWLIMPEFKTMQNGDTFTFYTTTTTASAYPDRLEFRLSTAGAGTNVGTGVNTTGTFTTLLTSVNPNLTVGGYPENWTQFTVTLSGLTGVVDGRVAFRYYVTSGGPTGANSNVIGLDQFTYTAAAVPEPSSYALAGLGMAALAGFGYSRRSRPQTEA